MSRFHTPGIMITCSKCGCIGGTFLKIDDHYEHQDKDACKLLEAAKLKREAIRAALLAAAKLKQPSASSRDILERQKGGHNAIS